MNEYPNREGVQAHEDRIARLNRMRSARRADESAKWVPFSADGLGGWENLSFSAGPIVSFECQFIDKDTNNARPIMIMEFISQPLGSPFMTFILNPWPTPSNFAFAFEDGTVEGLGFNVLVQGLQKNDLFGIRTTSGGVLQGVNLIWVSQNDAQVVSNAQAGDAWVYYGLAY